ncbi:MAG TPA: TetR family transcriptional regulator [Gemmatimonadaceae bacterium]
MAVHSEIAPPNTASKRQQRGRERVDTILDAAAALIAEDSLASVTMHRVAERSWATIGSMYHFFPNVTAVIEALAERIEQDVQTLLLAVDASEIDWATLTTTAAVDAFLDPIIEYGDAHPALFALLRAQLNSEARGLARIDALMLQLTGQIVGARRPQLTRAERLGCSAAILGVIEGISRRAERVARSPKKTLLAEMKRVIVAYLDASR